MIVLDLQDWKWFYLFIFFTFTELSNFLPYICSTFISFWKILSSNQKEPGLEGT